MIEIFLLPWTMAKWTSSLGIWLFILSFIRQSDTYFTTMQWCKDKINRQKSKIFDKSDLQYKDGDNT